MDEKKINEIIRWITIKKVRAHIREFFNEYNNAINKINLLENNIKILNKKLNIENEIVFTNIFKTNYWGSSESFSGEGSTMSSTENLRGDLIEIIKKYNIKTILDIPCGDFNWMRTIVNNFESYTGCDIVLDIINSNNEKYSNEKIKFKNIDLCNDKLDKVDLIFTRDCLQHLPLDYVKKALENIKNSGSKYLIASSLPYLENNNEDIKLGDCRYLNLEKEPFNLPKPIFIIKESPQPPAPDKYMCMWEIDKI